VVDDDHDQPYHAPPYACMKSYLIDGFGHRYQEEYKKTSSADFSGADGWETA